MSSVSRERSARRIKDGAPRERPRVHCSSALNFDVPALEREREISGVTGLSSGFLPCVLGRREYLIGVSLIFTSRRCDRTDETQKERKREGKRNVRQRSREDEILDPRTEEVCGFFLHFFFFLLLLPLLLLHSFSRRNLASVSSRSRETPYDTARGSAVTDNESAQLALSPRARGAFFKEPSHGLFMVSYTRRRYSTPRPRSDLCSRRRNKSFPGGLRAPLELTEKFRYVIFRFSSRPITFGSLEFVEQVSNGVLSEAFRLLFLYLLQLIRLKPGKTFLFSPFGTSYSKLLAVGRRLDWNADVGSECVINTSFSYFSPPQSTVNGGERVVKGVADEERY